MHGQPKGKSLVVRSTGCSGSSQKRFSNGLPRSLKHPFTLFLPCRQGIAEISTSNGSLRELNGMSILPATGKPYHRALAGRRKRMGLVKRGEVWWMSFVYEGRQIRRSTGTSDKR